MKKFFLLLIALFLISPISSQGATVLVRMTAQNTFDPADITINVGDTVTWTNVFATRHDSVSSDGLWASPLLGFRGTFSFTFNNPGTFGYFCTPHIDVGMFGTVRVSGGTQNNPP